jgi:3-methyladenine DNA glycosylase AlkD
LRLIARKFRGAPLSVIVTLLKSSWHEERLLAVLLMAQEYKHGEPQDQLAIYDAYLSNRAGVNNWDIVDSSAPLIAGPQLEAGSREILFKLAASERLWDRRIAMMSTLHLIRQGDFEDALRTAELLKDDEHDLIQKAVGWMLREVGNRDRAAEERFLEKHYRKMPRTMLRYAIERFPEARRKAYLNGKV